MSSSVDDCSSNPPGFSSVTNLVCSVSLLLPSIDVSLPAAKIGEHA